MIYKYDLFKKLVKKEFIVLFKGVKINKIDIMLFIYVYIFQLDKVIV